MVRVSGKITTSGSLRNTIQPMPSFRGYEGAGQSLLDLLRFPLPAVKMTDYSIESGPHAGENMALVRLIVITEARPLDNPAGMPAAALEDEMRAVEVGQ